MKRLLEICVDSIDSALIAQAGGADRVELCQNLNQGGTTPSAATIEMVKKELSIPVFVLIRPRKGDFLYSDREFQNILTDIDFAKKLGADGIVSGILRQNGEIDIDRTRSLILHTAPLDFTFHRAFDMSRDPIQSIEALANIGVSRILTSGQCPTAIEGISRIRKYSEVAGDRLSIMACGGLSLENVDPLLALDKLSEFHASARTKIRSTMTFRAHVNMGDEPADDEFNWFQVSEDLVSALADKIHGS